MECEPSELFQSFRIESHWSHTSVEEGVECNNHNSFANQDSSFASDKHVPKEICHHGSSDSDVDGSFGEAIFPGFAVEHTSSPDLVIRSPTNSFPISTINSPVSVTERFLLYHYTHKVSAVLVNVDGPSNPLRKVLLPRAVSSAVLMDALCATSAMHAFMSNHKAQFRSLSLGFYNRAVNAVRLAVETLDDEQNTASMENLLLTSIYLCKWEIISGGPHWRAHFQGIKQLWESDKVRQSIVKMDAEVVEFVRSL